MLRGPINVDFDGAGDLTAGEAAFCRTAFRRPFFRSAGWRLLAAAWAALWLAGCLTIGNFGGSNGSGGSGGASAKDGESFYDFMDVPFPSAMSLDSSGTFTYSRRGVLSGVVAVVGRMNVEELGAWFDVHLPSYGWSPLAEAQNVKLVSTWTKGAAVLTLIASPVTLSLGGDVRLELWVAPPHLKSDLGKRVVYETTGGKARSTTPVRSSKPKGSVTEEDI
ncbi:MAG: hypothetical protein LBU12_03585 [Deltaproteobacteria bacterium]|nr:hypothetical protein [Deltaproteobacteria bacterium]